MPEAELMFPVEIGIERGDTAQEVVFTLPYTAILRERYQHALEQELDKHQSIERSRAYGQKVKVDTTSENAAQDTILHEYVVGKIRDVLLRASLGR